MALRLSFVYAIALLCCASSYAAVVRTSTSGQKPCARITTIKVANTTLPYCREFYSGAVAIKLPADTKTVKFGAVKNFGSSGTFVDRKGAETPFPDRMLPAFLRGGSYHSGSESMSQMVFKAKFNKTKIVAINIELLIDQAAMVLPFRGLSFIGSVINSAPLPEGINETYWFRWDLGSKISFFERSDGEPTSSVWALNATFVNLYNGVVQSAGNASGVCHPSLIQDDASAEWFEHAVGNGTDIKLYWYSDMHASLDSELVPVFSNHVSYMASALNPALLLASNVNVKKQYNFVIHGTPVGVLMYFSGTFSKQLPPVGCAIN